jgi:hydroxymethylbilane synthase
LHRKGIFEREIDRAVRDGRADFAVHSLKDVPTRPPFGLEIVAVLPRESPNDVLVSRHGVRLEELAPASRIGTSSLRRLAQVKQLRPDLQVVPIRGNEETRVNKALGGDVDAVILAEAGLRRLGLQAVITEQLPLDSFTPAPGQGIIAVIARADTPLSRAVQRIDHRPTHAEGTAERAVVSLLEGGCRVPLGAIARARRRTLHVRAVVYAIDGRHRLEAEAEAPLEEATQLGRQVGRRLLRLGAKKVTREWRQLRV